MLPLFRDDFDFFDFSPAAVCGVHERYPIKNEDGNENESENENENDNDNKNENENEYDNENEDENSKIVNMKTG